MNLEQVVAVGMNILTMLLTATLIMLVYSIRSNRQDFNFVCWFQTNKNRFAVVITLAVGLSVLMAISPDFNMLLQIIGFNADKTPVGLGVAIGALLIAGVSGNHSADTTRKPINTEDNL